ncbi:MAG TPA: hypothetical protein VJ816_02390 [Gemmatimonadales bacterium]|nr:hypothetical protein [Gemmatimonadales bacterium]
MAQVAVHATLGARYTSTLVHDSIVDPFDVRPDIAPSLTAGADLPLSGPWRLELLADVSTSPLRRHLSDGTSPTITRLWMLGLAVGLRRQLEPWLHGRLAIGALKYLPASSIGLFQNGSTLTPYGSVAFVLTPPLATRHRLALELGGDLHRFLTPALRNNGFVDPRAVYRVTAGVRIDLWGRR